MQLNKPVKVTDARLAVTDLTYDATTGLLTQLTQPGFTPAGESAPRRPVTSFTYDGVGRLTTATDPSGMVSRYVYSATHETLITRNCSRGWQKWLPQPLEYESTCGWRSPSFAA